MNKISLKEARREIASGLIIARYVKGMKSKGLIFYPFEDKGKRYVATYLDEGGRDESEMVESEFLLTALSAYNDYRVE